jgi:hypothetical protein
MRSKPVKPWGEAGFLNSKVKIKKSELRSW